MRLYAGVVRKRLRRCRRRRRAAGGRGEFRLDSAVDTLDARADVGQRSDGRQRNEAGKQGVLDDVRAAFVGDEVDDAFHGSLTSSRIWMNHHRRSRSSARKSPVLLGNLLVAGREKVVMEGGPF